MEEKGFDHAGEIAEKIEKGFKCRELSRMKKEGIIEINKNVIKILI